MIYQELSLAPHLSRDGEHPPGRGAHAVRARGSAADARDRDVAHWRDLGHDDISPDAPVGSLRSPRSSSSRLRARIAVGCRVLVLDEPTSSLGRADVERLFDLLAPAEGAGPRHRLHLALHRRGEGGRRPLHRAARRPQRRRRSDGRRDARRHRRADGRRGRRRSLPAFDRVPRRSHPGSRRRSSPDRLRSRCTAARFSASPGLIGSGRTRLLRTLFGLAPVRSGRVRMAMFTRIRDPAQSAGSRAWACSAKIATDEGLALGLDIADNLTMTRLSSFGPAGLLSPARQRAAASRWIERLRDQVRRTGSVRRRSSPAATSRKSRSRGCSTTTSTCCCSTSRRAASTSAARRRSTG